jgi:hypothetical protein
LGTTASGDLDQIITLDKESAGLSLLGNSLNLDSSLDVLYGLLGNGNGGENQAS